MHILALVLIYFFLADFTSYSSEKPVRNKVQVVVIDPGHGGKDPGALGSTVKEKEIVLSIGLKLGKYIEEHFDDVKVIYTRKSDEFIPLDERAQIANDAKADLFISIHANAVPRASAIGTETFVIGRHKDEENFELAKKENSVILLEEDYETKYQGFDPKSIDSYIIFSVMQKTYQEHSLAMAKMVQDEFELRARRVNRGVKPAGFVVLWMTTMPSILVETGFLTHPEEEKYLASEQGQDHLASAIFRAFRNYKNSIEENSNFQRIAVKEKESPDIASAEKQKDEIYFKVQVIVSKKKLDTEDRFFRGYKNIEEFKAGNWHKYAVGYSTSYNEIEAYCEKVREDFPDAFVIAVRDGELLNLNEALKAKR